MGPASTDDIPGLGKAEQEPRQNAAFAPDTEFSSEDYFVWTRCDGRTSLRQIIAMVGLGRERTIEILIKLRSQGAVLFEGETSDSIAVKTPEQPPASTLADSSQVLRTRARRESTIEVESATYPVVLARLTTEESAALEEDVCLSDEDRRIVLTALRAARKEDHFGVLGIELSATRREVKRAYFRLSKTVHPDRYYKRDTGSFGPWLTEVFEAAGRAHTVLSDAKKRKAYEARRRGEVPGVSRAQTREEHAAALFEEACGCEVRGAVDEAMRRFAAAIRLDPQLRYLRRAARCGSTTHAHLTIAEEYATQATELRPKDPSTWRILAEVLRAGERYDEAEVILVQACELKTENDALAGELASDLERVRAAMRGK